MNQPKPAKKQIKPLFLLLLILFPVVYSTLFDSVLWEELSWSVVFLFYFICIPLFLIQTKQWAKQPAHLTAILTSFFLFCLYGVLAIQKSSVPAESTLSMFRTSGLFLLLWFSSTFLSTWSLKRNALCWLLSLGAVLSLYEMFNQTFNVESKILWTSNLTSEPAATFACRNHFAYFLEILLPFCLPPALFSKKKSLLRNLSIAGLILFPTAIILTHSRAGVMGSLVALTVTGMALIYKKRLSLFKRSLFILPLSALLLLGGVLAVDSAFREESFSQIKGLFEGKRGRTAFYMDTIDMIRAKPITGHGPGTFESICPAFRNEFKGANTSLDHPHNEFLECISEFGIIGGVLVAWGIIACMTLLIRRIKKETDTEENLLPFAFLGAIAGTLFHSSFDFQLHILPNALTLMILAGISIPPPRLSQTNQSPSKKHPLALFLTLLILLSSIIPLTSECLQSIGSFFLSSEKNVFQAEKYYKHAIFLEPNNWKANLGLGIVYQNYSQHVHGKENRQILLAEALRFTKTANMINPYNSPTSKLMGALYHSLNQHQNGLNTLRECAIREPFFAGRFHEYGKSAYLTKHYNEATFAFWKSQQLSRRFSEKKQNYLYYQKSNMLRTICNPTVELKTQAHLFSQPDLSNHPLITLYSSRYQYPSSSWCKFYKSKGFLPLDVFVENSILFREKASERMQKWLESKRIQEKETACSL